MYSIVVPCYNEEKNLSLILEKFSFAIKDQNIEVILVNNGSTDGSNEEFIRLMPKYHFVRVINVPVNNGYGFGILQGLRGAKGDFIGWTHADMQTDPLDVIKAFEIIKKHQNPIDIFVKGVRRGRGVVSNIFTVGMSVFESLYLVMPLWEINAQPNVFHRSFYESWSNPPHDFSLDLFAYYLAKKRKFCIKRFSVAFPPRIHGFSSWDRSFKDKVAAIIKVIKYSIKLKRYGGNNCTSH